MPVNLSAPDASALFPVSGIELGTATAGIRRGERDDLMVIRAASGTRAGGVFTRNRFCAAPVTICREHLAATGGHVRGLYINAGNANSGTGEFGLRDAMSSCETLAGVLDCTAQEILPMSTGVILEPLPMQALTAAIPRAVDVLDSNNWLSAANAIMTTDTIAKAVSVPVAGADAQYVTGIAKGAGMIRPDMGTMLSVLATDAQIAPDVLQQWTREAADQSFNRITVDGDTSTNDTFLILASGNGGLKVESAEAPAGRSLRDALFVAARDLAQRIVRDGEGATKFISIHVEQAGSVDEASEVAYTLAHSPLVKTAFFASDPNLGRLLCAIGYADVPDLDINAVQLMLGDVLVASNGGRHPDYQEADGQRVMSADEIAVTVRLGRGTARTTVWTCDLSHDYVSINADYRT